MLQTNANLNQENYKRKLSKALKRLTNVFMYAFESRGNSSELLKAEETHQGKYIYKYRYR